jgi:hypothetical protein
MTADWHQKFDNAARPLMFDVISRCAVSPEIHNDSDLLNIPRSDEKEMPKRKAIWTKPAQLLIFAQSDFVVCARLSTQSLSIHPCAPRLRLVSLSAVKHFQTWGFYRNAFLSQSESESISALFKFNCFEARFSRLARSVSMSHFLSLDFSLRRAIFCCAVCLPFELASKNTQEDSTVRNVFLFLSSQPIRVFLMTRKLLRDVCARGFAFLFFFRRHCLQKQFKQFDDWLARRERQLSNCDMMIMMMMQAASLITWCEVFDSSYRVSSVEWMKKLGWTPGEEWEVEKMDVKRIC